MCVPLYQPAIDIHARGFGPRPLKDRSRFPLNLGEYPMGLYVKTTFIEAARDLSPIDELLRERKGVFVPHGHGDSSSCAGTAGV